MVEYDALNLETDCPVCIGKSSSDYCSTAIAQLLYWYSTTTVQQLGCVDVALVMAICYTLTRTHCMSAPACRIDKYQQWSKTWNGIQLSLQRFSWFFPLKIFHFLIKSTTGWFLTIMQSKHINSQCKRHLVSVDLWSSIGKAIDLDDCQVHNNTSH